MSANISRRLVIIVAVVTLSLWAIYPPRENIKLGLDLNGGVHLVLRVDTDQAVQQHTNAAVERLREALGEQRIAFVAVDVVGPGEFRVDGISDAAAFRRVAASAETAFDRVEQDGAHVFRMRPALARALESDTVEQALHTIERRVNELGVSEPTVARYADDDRILVQLPGVEDADRAKQIIKSTAQLRLTLVESGPFPSRDAAMHAYANGLPTTLEVLPGPAESPAAAATYYVVHRSAAVTGGDLRDARQSSDEFNRPAVTFTLKNDAAQRFSAFTERHVNRALATVLDDRITSVATIISRIDGEGQIVGLSREEMIEQTINFRTGALPADLEYVEERTVGASLGDASIRSGVLASVGGLTLVTLFMLGYYRLAGLNAAVSIVLNLIILVGFVALIPVKMTLPGIAGLILTIGMGVDSNVLIFERIKEELGRARGAGAAVRAGFDRVWITIVDTHVTSLIAAAFLFQFGTSPIRGFATTLTIGLVANVFTAVFASRTLFELMLRWRRASGRTLSISSPIALVRSPGIDVTRWAPLAMLLSLVVIGAGVAALATRGLPLGIDFSGGTMVVAEFAAAGVTEDDVRAAVATLPGDEVVQRFGAAADRQFLIRLPLADAAGQAAILDTGVRHVTEALEAANLPAFRIVDRQLVSATIGEDLQWRGINATVASIVAIAIYIGLRFRFSFAIGAFAATFHDILVTLACLAVAGYDLSLHVTAALLTVIGYSVNDTIVVFDRVRENARTRPDESLATVVNLSVNQTLSRTLITAGTTLLSVLALYVFGGEALRGFAFTLLVGIVSGTYSTVFIASATATLLSRRPRPRRVAGQYERAVSVGAEAREAGERP